MLGHSCPDVFRLRYQLPRLVESLQMASCGLNPTQQMSHGASESNEYGLVGLKKPSI